MKLLKLTVVGLMILLCATTQAQVSINVNINARPLWGPSVEEDVRYYYLPDVDVYYDIPTAMFIYLHNGQWIHRRHLPHQFSHYDLHRGRKIIVYDYRGNKPYIHCKLHKGSYRKECERGYYKNQDRPGKGYGKNYSRGKDSDRDHGRGHGKK